MGFYVLHDAGSDRAVIYDSTSERPVDTSGFIGGNARELAESFLAYLMTEHNGVRVEAGDFVTLTCDLTDPRCYSSPGLERARERWYQVCTSGESDELNEYGTRLWEWWLGSRRELSPEPAKLQAVDGEAGA